MSGITEHCDWEEALQDRIDGDLDAAQCAALDEHLAGCSLCRARMSALQEIDLALSRSLPPQGLGASFDRGIFEQIATAEKTDRLAARARLEQELQAQMAALSTQWRQSWKALALNVVAGAAVLVAWIAGFGGAEVVASLTDQAALLLQSAILHPAATLLAAVGLSAVSLWLVRAFTSLDWRAE